MHCSVSDSISLAVRFPDSLRMEYGPTRPNRTATTPRTPDVIVVNKLEGILSHPNPGSSHSAAAFEGAL